MSGYNMEDLLNKVFKKTGHDGLDYAIKHYDIDNMVEITFIINDTAYLMYIESVFYSTYGMFEYDSASPIEYWAATILLYNEDNELVHSTEKSKGEIDYDNMENESDQLEDNLVKAIKTIKK